MSQLLSREGSLVISDFVPVEADTRLLKDGLGRGRPHLSSGDLVEDTQSYQMCSVRLHRKDSFSTRESSSNWTES